MDSRLEKSFNYFKIIKEYIQESKKYSLLKSNERYLLSPSSFLSNEELLLDTQTMMFYTPAYDYEEDEYFIGEIRRSEELIFRHFPKEDCL